jgi:hypothetical protein
MKNKILLLKIVTCITAVILLSISLQSCTYDYLSPEEFTIPAEVSFKQHVVPIFSKNCNSSGCHNSGGAPPDLTVDNAHMHLSQLGLIDPENPEKSILYIRMRSVSKPMPPDGLLPESQIQMILEWIKQGAEDN